MKKNAAYQQILMQNYLSRFPSTRYQGSKAKLAEWIWNQVADLGFSTCLDIFGGTAAIAYRLKQAGKQVTYNDRLRFNYYIGQSLIENNHTYLMPEETDWLLGSHPTINYPYFVQNTFSEVYFTDEENAWIDRTVTNIRHLTDPYKFALGFFALAQACTIKRPYNLFHRKNLYIRFANVERSFGNKTTWDRPFDEWFRIFVAEANQAVFDNGQANHALNFDAMHVPGEYDLVYIDTPYMSKQGIAVDYLAFYHFLEGLTIYPEWDNHIDKTSKHLRLKSQPTEWTDRKLIYDAFDRLFQRYQKSILVVSYRNDGIPSESELVSLLKRYKSDVSIKYYGPYKYVLSTNEDSKEILLVGS